MIQHGINTIQYVIERSISHMKAWRIFSNPCRIFRATTIRAINVIRRIMFYQTPPEAYFSSD